MKRSSESKIFTNKLILATPYFTEKGGIINALTYANAQYVFKVLEKYKKNKIKWFDSRKVRRIRRTIIHKNAHLDEYFAELLFRAILPPHLKDIEVCEHVLLSKEDDSFAKISWPSGVVFGIHTDETGGAKALAFYDEHESDGSRKHPSCSQLVAEEFLGNSIPLSVEIILDEVSASDSRPGAHQYNLKNVFFAMHDTMFVVGRDEISGTFVTKYLTENWKRAIVGACIVAMIYCYENGLLSYKFSEEEKIKLEVITKKSLDYFLNNSILAEYSPNYFHKVKNTFLYHFKVWNDAAKVKERNRRKWHGTLDNAIWKDEDGKELGKQILIIQPVCYALQRCWGKEIANFVMMHIWQLLFQQQLSFHQIKNEIMDFSKSTELKVTSFGHIKKTILDGLSFKPEQGAKDKRMRNLDLDSPLWIYEAIITDPKYPNVKKVLSSILNGDYTAKGNNGFGVFIIHDKTINSKAINIGPTFPYNIWKKLSDKITQDEPDKWFQLQPNGIYAHFLLNRTKAHQEQLPSELVDGDYLVEAIKSL